MDIAALSAVMSKSSLALQVGASVLSINKDLMEQQGQALMTLLQAANTATPIMEQSVSPHLGGNIDIKL